MANSNLIQFHPFQLLIFSTTNQHIGPAGYWPDNVSIDMKWAA